MPSGLSSKDVVVGPAPSGCPYSAKLHSRPVAPGSNGESHTSTDGKPNGEANGGAALNGNGPRKFSSSGEQVNHKVQKGSTLVNGTGVENDLESGEVSVEERKWIRPDLPSRCTWKLGMSHDGSPHSHPER